jgi:3-deoxy-D-manno-octulosonic-acid transferase
VGEAQSAALLLKALQEQLDYPQYLLSVSTPAGLSHAEKLFKDDKKVQVIAGPLDHWGAPRRIFDRVEPCALILVENEIWPGLLRKAQQREVPVILAAGRISEKSLRHYRLFPSFFRQLFSSMSLITLISRKDEARLILLGVDPDKLLVLGSPKFDTLITLARNEPPLPAPLSKGPYLLVAGSTHPGEEELILKALAKLLPGKSAENSPVKLILAPRHTERAAEILELARRKGFTADYTNDPKATTDSLPQVGIVSTMGKLKAFYEIGDLAIVGGSFFQSYQGHNPYEPAALGKPVIFGPYMSSFSGEADLLIEAEGAISVEPSTLAAVLAQYVDDPALSHKTGLNAKEALASQSLVAPIIASQISCALGDKIKKP